METLEVSVGILRRPSLRRFLNESRFKGWSLDYIESKRFLGSDFVVRGDKAAIQMVFDVLQENIERWDEIDA